MPAPKWLAPVLSVVVLGGIFGMCVGIVKCQDWQSAAVAAASVPPPPETHRETMIDMALGGAMMLRESMRDPASFEIVGALLMPGERLCYQYRARNGFGGMNVELAVFDHKKLRTQTMAGFDAEYARTCNGRLGDDVTTEVEQRLARTPMR